MAERQPPRPTPAIQASSARCVLRTGFTGNVLGFGVKKRISDTTEVLGYSAVTVGIDSDERAQVQHRPARLARDFPARHGPLGQLHRRAHLGVVLAGRVEITYLYGYRYGLGFPGGITPAGQSTAGERRIRRAHQRFRRRLRLCDAQPRRPRPPRGHLRPSNNIVAHEVARGRTRWPRPEYELIFTAHLFGATGLVKIFQNGAYQKVYDYDGTTRSADIWGFGAGGRLEAGPVRIGLAGHYGKGIGVDYAMQPHGSLYFVEKAQATRTRARR